MALKHSRQPQNSAIFNLTTEGHPSSGRCLKGHVPGAQKVSENGGSPEFKALFVGKVLNNNKPQDLGVTG